MKTSIQIAAVAVGATVCGLLGYVSASATPSHPAQPSTPAGQTVIAAQRIPLVTQESFVPISPCRIIDTRSGGGAIDAKTTRAFHVYGSAGIAAQGGKSGGCGLPATAGAVAISTTTTDEAGNGYLAAYPTGTSRPTSTTLSFPKGSTTTTLADVKLGQGTGKVLSVYASNQTQLVVDVVGYYSAPLEVLTQPGGGVFAGSNRVVSITNPATGVYDVTFDVDVSNCAATATVYDDGAGGYYANASTVNGTEVTVFTYALSSTAAPVAQNKFAYLTVTC
jgi:hypothetical protein